MKKLGLLMLATCLSSAAVATADLSREEVISGLKDRMAVYSRSLEGDDLIARLEAAEAVYGFSLEQLGAGNKNTAVAYLNVVRAHTAAHGRQNPDLAAMWDRAVDLYEEAYGDEEPIKLLDPLYERARYRAVTYNHRKARLDYARLYQIIDDNDLEPAIGLEIAMAEGLSMLGTSNRSYVLSALRRARDYYKATPYPSQRQRGRMAKLEGSYDFWRGKESSAAEHFKEALNHLPETDPTAAGERISILPRLIHALEKTGRRDEATPYCREVGRIKTAMGDFEHVPLFKIAPVYPMSAARAGLEGEVLVTFTVDENGFVRDPVVKDRKGPASFETVALEAVTKFRYAPRVENGEPVATPGVENLITFELRS